MFSIGKVPNPHYGRMGADGGRPLAVRFEEIRARAIREIPHDDVDRGCINLMQSEASIDMIFEAISRSAARRAPPEPSKELRQAWNDLSAMQRNYNQHVVRLKEAQGRHLWRA